METTAESTFLCEHQCDEIGRRLKTDDRTALIDSPRDASAAVSNAERASSVLGLPIARVSNKRTWTLTAASR